MKSLRKSIYKCFFGASVFLNAPLIHGSRAKERRKRLLNRGRKEKMRHGGRVWCREKALQEVLEAKEVWLRAVCSALVDQGCLELSEDLCWVRCVSVCFCQELEWNFHTRTVSSSKKARMNILPLILTWIIHQMFCFKTVIKIKKVPKLFLLFNMDKKIILVGRTCKS